MNRKPKQFDDDDGRVICNMDVEGMRWHDKRVRREKRALRLTTSNDAYQMSAAETRSFTYSALLAGLSMVLVFAAVWGLFLLFCTQIWFR